MDMDFINATSSSNSITTSTFLWCFFMPLIHVIGLISNLLCIIVFCSNVFIKKPIAIYFICLLISDSITLLIGYIEMIDRESNMIDKSSLWCIFNEKIIHPVSDAIYTFMGRFCLEWILYKILWTRVSTILLAILSIQRCRTFFSLSYHESRLCAVSACVFSLTFASIITCMEWTGVQYDQVDNPRIYYEVFQSMMEKNGSKEFYVDSFSRNFNESHHAYVCLMDALNRTSWIHSNNQSNCSLLTIGLEFHSMTRSLLSNRDPNTVETVTNLLASTSLSNSSSYSLLEETVRADAIPENVVRLFEKRSCHIVLPYSLWLRFYDFLHSVSFGWNRRVMAVFLANALPSFIVAAANLVSLKVIYFSKSLKYLRESSRKNRRKRRLQNDLRAFLVILIESFSIILISWGIPIFLTMYHCRTLYVVNIANCPKIKDYLALFLCTDLFNSSTNCLLYSLSGKLFRRKVLYVIKTFLTCGRGVLWSKKRPSMTSTHQPLDRQPSHNPSICNNSAKHASSRAGGECLSKHLSSPNIANQTRHMTNSPQSTTPSSYQRINGQHRSTSDEGSFSIGRGSDDQHGRKNSSSEIESDSTRRSTEIQLRKHSQSITSYLMGKVRSFGSASSASGKRSSIGHPLTVLVPNPKPIKSKRNFLHSILSKRQATTDLSLSSSSFSGSAPHSIQRTHSPIHRSSIPRIRSIHDHTIDNLSAINNHIHENLTSL